MSSVVGRLHVENRTPTPPVSPLSSPQRPPDAGTKSWLRFGGTGELPTCSTTCSLKSKSVMYSACYFLSSTCLSTDLVSHSRSLPSPLHLPISPARPLLSVPRSSPARLFVSLCVSLSPLRRQQTSKWLRGSARGKGGERGRERMEGERTGWRERTKKGRRWILICARVDIASCVYDVAKELNYEDISDHCRNKISLMTFL